jgi:hypothetical protein
MTNDSPCANIQYFADIIGGAQNVLSGVTVHHYGLLSAHKSPNNCNVEDFLDPNLIFKHEEKYDIWRDTKNNFVGTKADSGIELILGETASAGTGGCSALSNSFAAGFWWVHTLGEVASLQYDQIYRQNLVGWSGIGDMSHYTLAGDPGWSGAYIKDATNASRPPKLIPPAVLTANPDFYTSVLWKRIMSPIVLRVTLQNSAMLQGVSMHFHCAAQRTDIPSGAVAMSYANTRNRTVFVSLTATDTNSADGGGEIEKLVVPRIEYFLRTGDLSGDLQSRFVRLNNANDPLSSSSPMDGHATSKGVLALPPLSYGFIVLQNSKAHACIHSSQPTPPEQ